MKLHLLAAASIAVLALNAPAYAQSADSNSNSGAQSTAIQGMYNGGNYNGGSSVGDTNAASNSDSTSVSGAISGSNSQGGNAQSGSNATGGTSTATGGTSSANATNAASNAGNAQSITFNNNSAKDVRTVPTVYAPALTTTLTETCMGSTSAGASVLGGGLTIGTTWRDPACMRRLNARELAQTLGDREAARAVLCGDAEIADAYERLGRPCPKSTYYRSELAAQYMPQLPGQQPTPPTAADTYAMPQPTPDLRRAPEARMEPIPNPDEGYRTPRQ